jgi:isopenicillin-N N-acyltransferase like protein
MTVVDCAGDGRTRGRAHGEAAREAVVAAVGRWADATAAASRTPIERYASRFLESTELLPAVARHCPELHAELHGMAEGADVPFALVAAYNLMDEQWWYDAERGCSVIGVAHPGAPVVLAQNMDLPAFMDGSQLVLRVSGSDQPEALVLTSAGLLGLAGVNAAGVAVCVNTLMMLRHSSRGLAVAAVLRGALACRDRHAAAAWLRDVPHASGQHYAVADRRGVVGFECSAGGAALSCPPDARTLLHTNHPLASTDVDPHLEDRLERAGRIANSERRQGFLVANGDEVDGDEAAKELLEDRATPICVVPSPGRATQTFASVAFRLGSQVDAEFRLGLPETATWERIAFSEATVGAGA